MEYNDIMSWLKEFAWFMEDTQNGADGLETLASKRLPKLWKTIGKLEKEGK